jgi:hypothetical protein
MSPPRIQMNGPAPVHTTPPPPSGRVFDAKPTFAAVPSSQSSPTPYPSRGSLRGLATTTKLSLDVRSFDTSVTDNAPPNLCRNQPSTSRQSCPYRPSAPQCGVEHQSTLNQSTKVYPAQTLDQHRLVDPALHHVHHLTLPPPQIEQVTQPRTLLDPLSSNQGPSCSQFRGQGMFPQAHDFVVKDSVLVDNPVFVNNSSDNCEYRSIHPVHS